MSYTFNLGSATIETDNINELREVIEELKTKIDVGGEYSIKVTDFIFSVEAAYQSHHNLSPDDWEIKK